MSGTVRVGIVVPASNPTVEPEIQRLLPARMVGYTARIVAPAGLDLRDRLTWYRENPEDSLDSLRGLGLSAVLVACTGATYPLGVEGDRAWSAAQSARLGLPVLTSAGALAEALSLLDTAHVSLVSPYPAWLTDQCAAFWRGAGLSVREFPLSGTGAIYDTAPEDVGAAVRATLATETPAGGRAVVVTGTGAPSLAALDAVAASSPIPVLSSNLAGAWALARVAGAGGLLAHAPGAALRRLDRDTLEGAR